VKQILNPIVHVTTLILYVTNLDNTMPVPDVASRALDKDTLVPDVAAGEQKASRS
jgi:hypothetical protein